MSTSTPVPLASGTYLISSISTKQVISRTHIEDLSLNPKKIVTLPPGAIYAPWIVTKNPDGTYILRNRNDPVVDIDDKLYAELFQVSPPREKRWRITAVPNHGPDQYIIESADLKDGWLLPPNATPQALTQVEVKPLIVFLSLPPQYPTNERFLFKRLYQVSS